MKKMLVTRPNYDKATSYTFYYAGLVIKEAEKKGINVIDLKRPRLTRNSVTSIIENKEPGLIFFNAHGNEKIIFGDKINKEPEVLIKEGENHNILNFKLVYARTCMAASSLGKKIKGGCFIGYETPFSFWTDKRIDAVPERDKTARLFFEPSNLIVISLLKGNTAEEAVKKSANLTKKTILKLLRTKEEGSMALISRLWNNMEGICISGNKQMTF